ncbi:hypothetical protein [Microbacterium sp. VKM Ac-2923]|uniref:hypothetical protein n=1 Tax=Microbacterium sp. VKM Ac-2923 TaxID=2929476 RepID=UPI001FB4BF08|nr:hypothetical protein [Microbacterium sp. VKM Ac-2923]MCJ1708431.1 hypothetical protein [Microbacterium sp. VKM Ac-2923]
MVSDVKKVREVPRFRARLRGEDVFCTVRLESPDALSVAVETAATSLKEGLRAVSKFAGYCERTLILDSWEEAAWAEVMASYFGFGLTIANKGVRCEVMPPPTSSDSKMTGARRQFIRRVIEQQEANS